jgi:hypothetical protein
MKLKILNIKFYNNLIYNKKILYIIINYINKYYQTNLLFHLNLISILLLLIKIII